MSQQDQRLEFMGFFYKYLEDNELEVQIAAMNSLKHCAKFIPPDHIEKEIVPRLNEYFLKPLANLQNQSNMNMVNQMPINVNGPSEYVVKNQSLAENLMFIGSCLSPENVKRCLLPVFESLLNCNHPLVRLKLFENTHQLATIFGSSTLLEVIKKEFNKFVGDNNWRIRKQGFEMIESFGKKFADSLFEDPEVISKIKEGLADRVSIFSPRRRVWLIQRCTA